LTERHKPNKKWHPQSKRAVDAILGHVTYRLNSSCFTPRIKLFHWSEQNAKTHFLGSFESRTPIVSPNVAISTHAPAPWLRLLLRQLVEEASNAVFGLIMGVPL
jgi:hypothetical protein